MFLFQHSKCCVYIEQGTDNIHTSISIHCARGLHLSVLPLFTSSGHHISKDLWMELAYVSLHSFVLKAMSLLPRFYTSFWCPDHCYFLSCPITFHRRFQALHALRESFWERMQLFQSSCGDGLPQRCFSFTYNDRFSSPTRGKEWQCARVLMMYNYVPVNLLHIWANGLQVPWRSSYFTQFCTWMVPFCPWQE